ncbi:hypothetical protein MMYC01_203948 [Madurella mycetomatis]|uniref:Uncharacterized protein n=1 Tax=Madurella mycetomatis TaxID=100816 RepID=A0A175WC18_9PEZI|nr:hypothetical protein MMYC01_203948 [Madurella mycetomatis]
MVLPFQIPEPVFYSDIPTAPVQTFCAWLSTGGIMAAPEESRWWNFDVSSLMVLVGETEEQKYREAGRSVIEAFAATPVAGAQTYLKSYEFLGGQGGVQYFSPYGMKWAPLRNPKLENAIHKTRLLEDGNFTHLRIASRCSMGRQAPNRQLILTWLWVAFTWLSFAAIISFCVYAPHTTWVSLVTCITYTGWSVILRLVECFVLVPASHTRIFGPDNTDAVFILGRDKAGILLEGRREDIKRWTSSSLVYRNITSTARETLQAFTRVGTALVLLLVFAAVPNGSTSDQLAFIMLNLLGQINTLVALRLNAMCCMAIWVVEARETPRDRTTVYAHLIRRFAHLDQAWITKSGILPDTPAWDKWKVDILRPENGNADPKALYNEIRSDELRNRGDGMAETDGWQGKTCITPTSTTTTELVDEA